jgi:hypothetical protein
MPGLAGAIAGKVEFKELKLLSGVMALICVGGAARFVGGGDTGGVDQANVAAGDAFLAGPPRFTAGLEGNVAEDEAEAGAFAQGSLPSMSEPVLAPCVPRTSASKSLPPSPLLVSSPLVPGRPPKLMNSFRDVVGALFAPSSCSFRVCSFSTRADRDLINSM